MTSLHLIVLIHGYEGSSSDFDNCARLLARKLGNRTVIFKPRSNSGFGGTYDGIENGSIRVWKEVMRKITDLEKDGSGIEAISIVGHSLGGLYARYLLRLLNDCFVFERIQPRFFITMATPHLSVRRPQRGAVNTVFQTVVSAINRTTKELCLEDENTVLYRMTEEPFIKPLRLFKRRLLYANVTNDFQVHYSTASISVLNPYNKNPATMARSAIFTDLTMWSLDRMDERKQHDLLGDVDVDDFAKDDTRGHLLRAMFLRLNDLKWERYDAVFGTMFAHEQIIFKRSLFAGNHVVKHLCEMMMTYDPNINTNRSSDEDEDDAFASADDGAAAAGNEDTASIGRGTPSSL